MAAFTGHTRAEVLEFNGVLATKDKLVNMECFNSTKQVQILLRCVLDLLRADLLWVTSQKGDSFFSTFMVNTASVSLVKAKEADAFEKQWWSGNITLDHSTGPAPGIRVAVNCGINCAHSGR